MKKEPYLSPEWTCSGKAEEGLLRPKRPSGLSDFLRRDAQAYKRSASRRKAVENGKFAVSQCDKIRSELRDQRAILTRRLS